MHSQDPLIQITISNSGQTDASGIFRSKSTVLLKLGDCDPLVCVKVYAPFKG